MAIKTLEEWIDIYEKRTGEKFDRSNKYNLFYLPDKGFCKVGQIDNMVIVSQTAGDARFWCNIVSEAAKESGLTRGGTWLIRKEVLAYIRLLGYKIERTEELEDGLKKYYCKHKVTGKWGLVSPAGQNEKGIQTYFITWE